MQFTKCSYCINQNPQCKNIFVDSITQLENLIFFINYQCFKKNYFVKKHNDPIPGIKIKYDCEGFALNPSKKEEYQKFINKIGDNYV